MHSRKSDSSAESSRIDRMEGHLLARVSTPSTARISELCKLSNSTGAYPASCKHRAWLPCTSSAGDQHMCLGVGLMVRIYTAPRRM